MNSDEQFQKIIDNIPEAIEAKLFGAKSIKSATGKAVAILWQDHVLLKLDKDTQIDALKLDGVKQAMHLYANDKQLIGWISIPIKHSDKWLDFTIKAFAFGNKNR